jgi:spermidine/putrescine transport system permease protein
MSEEALPPRAGRAGARTWVTALAGLAGVAVTAGLYTRIGSVTTGLTPAVALILCSVPVVVLSGLGLRRLGVIGSERGYPLTLMTPAAAYYAAFFLIPFALLVLFSVAIPLGYGDVQYGFSLESFRAALDGLYVNVFERTLRFAATGTLLVILVGVPMAYWLARRAPARYKNLFLGLIVVPFWTAFLIRTYSFLIMLDPAFPLSKALDSSGVTSGPLELIYTDAAVQIGLVYNYLPLFVLPAYAALERIDWTLLDAARDLGASFWKAMRQIVLPLAATGMLTGALIVFIPMMGEYVVPQILGGGKVDFMGNVIRRAFLEEQDYPFGAALAMLMMSALSGLVLLYIWLGARGAEGRDA